MTAKDFIVKNGLQAGANSKITGALEVTSNLTVGGTLDANGNVDLAATSDTATAATHYFVETATDGIIRPKTLANVKSEIVTTATVNSAAATTVGTITTGTWSADTIATNKGGTGLTSFTADRAVYATSTSALTTGILPVVAGGTGVGLSTGTTKVVLSDSPTLTGTPLAPTAVAGTNSTQIATTAFVTDAIGNGTLTLAVSGTGLSGSASFTANQSGNSTFTVTSNATSANTASTIVARDGSGDFSAGTITAGSLAVTGTLDANGNVDLAATADTATAATHYFVETSSDGIIRPKTLANVKTEIVTTAAVNSAAATTVGTITSGVWHGSVIPGQYGGTGVANTGKTITVSGNTSIGSSTHTVTFATSNNTSVTLPTTGTLATLDGSETLTNKTLTSPTINGATLNAASTIGGVSGTTLAAATGAWQAWTPTLKFGNQTETGYTLTVGKYIQIGKTVHCRLVVTFANPMLSTTGGVAITLPVSLSTANTQLLHQGFRFSRHASGATGEPSSISVFTESNTYTLNTHGVADSKTVVIIGSVWAISQPSTPSTGDQWYLTGTYETA